MTHLEKGQHDNHGDRPYIWARPEWPYFFWDSSVLLESLVQLRHQQGRLLALTPETAKNRTYKDFLTKETLCDWSAKDFRTNDFSENMISSFPAKRLTAEIEKFLNWWNDSPVGLDGIIRAGVAYFWFMTILPFADGNSFVAKKLVNLALAQDENLDPRPYELDQFFIKNKSQIEVLILSCQKLNGDLSSWLKWFFDQLFLSINTSLELKKKVANLNLNQRQKKILSYLSSIPGELVAVTNRDCVELCNTSRESIKRDLALLVSLGLLKRTTSSGRSVCYLLEK